MEATLGRDERIGPTAHYTAYVWYRLGFPYAGWFVTRRGRALFWGFRVLGETPLSGVTGVPTLERYLEMRHRTIESALNEERPDVIVELGAGLSRRGVTWVAGRGVEYHEVDLPPMVRAKRTRIRARADAAMWQRLDARLHHHEIDVLDRRFESALRDLVSRAQRPVVVAEGLLDYFALSDREQVIAAIGGALSGHPGAAFVASLRTKPTSARLRFATRVLRQAIGAVTKGRGQGQPFADEGALRRAARQGGFAEAESLDSRSFQGATTNAKIWRFRVAGRR